MHTKHRVKKIELNLHLQTLDMWTLQYDRGSRKLTTHALLSKCSDHRITTCDFMDFIFKKHACVNFIFRLWFHLWLALSLTLTIRVTVAVTITVNLEATHTVTLNLIITLIIIGVGNVVSAGSRDSVRSIGSMGSSGSGVSGTVSALWLVQVVQV